MLDEAATLATLFAPVMSGPEVVAALVVSGADEHDATTIPIAAATASPIVTRFE